MENIQDQQNRFSLAVTAELSTRLPMLLGIGVPYLIIAIAFVGWGRPELSESLPAFRAALLVALGVLAMWEVAKQQRASRLRLWMKLPFSSLETGLLRLVPLQVMALFFLAVYGLGRLATETVTGLPAELSTLLGVTLLFNALLHLYQDVMHGFQRQLLRMTGVVLFLIVLLGVNVGFVLMTMASKQTLPLVASLERGMATLLVPAGYFTLLALGLGIAILSINLFQKRKSYLE